MTNLERLRRERFGSRRALAPHLGVTDVAILDWEHRRHSPRLEHVRRLEALFGKRIDYLLSDAEMSEATDSPADGLNDPASRRNFLDEA